MFLNVGPRNGDLCKKYKYQKFYKKYNKTKKKYLLVTEKEEISASRGFEPEQ